MRLRASLLQDFCKESLPVIRITGIRRRITAWYCDTIILILFYSPTIIFVIVKINLACFTCCLSYFREFLPHSSNVFLSFPTDPIFAYSLHFPNFLFVFVKLFIDTAIQLPWFLLPIRGKVLFFTILAAGRTYIALSETTEPRPFPTCQKSKKFSIRRIFEPRDHRSTNVNSLVLFLFRSAFLFLFTVYRYLCVNLIMRSCLLPILTSTLFPSFH